MSDGKRPAESATSAELTVFLRALSDGHAEGEAELLPHVLRELNIIARSCLRGQVHTLQPTALVNEAYLKLFGHGGLDVRDRSHFFATAAKAIRQVLVDHARSRKRLKRGGGRAQVTLVADLALAPGRPEQGLDVLDLDEALSRLAERDPDQARIVELRFFGGLEVGEVADLLETSKSTVERSWRVARAWLGQAMQTGR